ncbi:hypothetical protein SPRG_22313 [Saprolegnia parasitica CBS 223.65]|uniref:Uncharacterized protein n=1 Tax=Saprolegnia parasitica (strain CBS 223.65) TaxID=695850 RepID=A0A067BYQ2_SAPPC|nr:hypothetical protein SPRG_22313 [Saprolegnia parasitica CBS 223.65]KDO21985.1 hypothetical protein SPRG_22313 [Saprolegnia parasitica CBS 223.65]|eukprot:XP_012207346.1 hypothetical protein SPRG_22313 [Saprolegnia parasitica CBS 223.65]
MTSYEEATTPTMTTTTTRQRVFHIPVTETIASGPTFIFQDALGKHENVTPPADELAAIRDDLNKPKHLLGEWPSTAICGNDIMSSVLYSSGIVALKAGKLAPICMAMVSVVLYMYRFIYEEVVTAIPMNGGSYNCLLNTTSKRVAAVAAVLSTLAYTATAVVSGTSACYYLQFVHEITEEIERRAAEMDIVVKEDNIRFFERENTRVSLLVKTIKAIKEQPFVFFIKSPDLTVLNKVILYVRSNEMTNTLRFVHVYAEPTDDALEAISALKEMVALFDRIYPKLKADLVTIHGKFEPALVQWLSHE